ncbi:hypothetical protein VTL71DRAFT_12897 [Oculimacula yallundae]|uniref:Uncharacterized protein n=1 Tax=Oculimacula yallundae TaxID=86028 RepID=A0ABR4CNS7_9HELO
MRGREWSEGVRLTQQLWIADMDGAKGFFRMTIFALLFLLTPLLSLLYGSLLSLTLSRNVRYFARSARALFFLTATNLVYEIS